MKAKGILLAACCVVLMGLAPAAAGVKRPEFSTRPVTKNGEKWKIGYYEGGPHDNYYNYFAATIAGLMNLGWIEQREIPFREEKDTAALWKWLATEVKSDFLEFSPGAYYSAKWDENRRESLRKTILGRLREAKDLDLICAMGTWAGKDLATNEHSTPIIIMSTSDPVGSGIIKSVEDSGFEHVHARVDPNRYERQVRIFHDIIGFQKLGVAYEDTVYGRTYAAIDRIEKLAKEKHFEIVRCFTKSDIPDLGEAAESVKACFRQLANSADAIYVTMQGGVNDRSIPDLVAIANEHRIPTFSQAGSKEVESGFLLSISRPSFKPVGLFLAATIAQVMNGAKPRELNQLFEESPNIAINLKTAEIVGIYLYADLLAAADEIYTEIPSAK
jgi:ABC-type uncharacterized transport system substrate-binding protein